MKSPRKTSAPAHGAVAQSARSQAVQSELAEPQLVEIEKPVYGGSFLARVEGKAVFVPLALPGEQARVRVVESRSGFSSAEAEEIVAPSPERVVPACPHFGVCGGCHYQHAEYAAQLGWKKTILRETLERGGVEVPAELDVLVAEPWAYRNRIRLAFDAAGNPGYRGRRSHAVVPISECPIAAPLLVEAARTFAEVMRKSAPALRPTEIALFCNADKSALLVTLFVTTPAKAGFDQLAKAMHELFAAFIGAELVIEARAAYPERRLAQWGAASLDYQAAGFGYRVDHGAFFQVNRWLVDALVERVTAGQKGTLAWDLFAGVGLFAHKLTAAFERVMAVESAPFATAALAHNLRGTGGKAVTAETLAYLSHVRADQHPDLIVVDPPRTGLGAETTALLGKVAAPAMVYVSCDPATLTRDLRALVASGYAIESVALADLFPQTFHLETVVRLRHC
jgi:23S rRNA (uracil1939-C5)-methyltransferase